MIPSEPPQSSDHSDSGLSFDDAAFHNQIKNVLFDVEVSEGLKDSILDSLCQNDVNLPASDRPVTLSPKALLKKPGILAGLSACLVFSAMFAYFWVARVPVIALSEFNPGLDLNSRFLSEFDNNFSDHYPSHGGWRLNGRLAFTQKLYGISIDQSAPDDAAARFFTLRMGIDQPVYGVLIQVPANRIEPQPLHQYFDPGNVEYTQLNKGNFATVKWVEDDQVYICIVFGGARELEALDRAIHTPSA